MIFLAEAIIGISIVIGLTLWYSPYICRVLAAALLTHADTTEESRDCRRRMWQRHSSALGIKEQTKPLVMNGATWPSQERS